MSIDGLAAPLAARVLIAEDDLEMRSWLTASLSRRGARVDEVESGAELVAALASGEPYELVVSDVRMSWADGVQAVRMARSAGFPIPFVIITSHADESILRAADELGVEVLEKPFPIERLVEAIGRALESGGSRALTSK